MTEQYSEEHIWI